MGTVTLGQSAYIGEILAAVLMKQHKLISWGRIGCGYTGANLHQQTHLGTWPSLNKSFRNFIPYHRYLYLGSGARLAEIAWTSVLCDSSMSVFSG